MEANQADRGIGVPRMQLLKLGKGKKAVPIFGVRAYASKYDNKAYEILHIPSNALLCDGFYYLTLARSIAEHLLENYPHVFQESNTRTLVGLLPQLVFDYLAEYRLKDVKQALSITDYQASPEHQELVVYRNSQRILEEQSNKYTEELSVGDNSLGWVSDSAGPISGESIRAFETGHRS